MCEKQSKLSRTLSHYFMLASVGLILRERERKREQRIIREVWLPGKSHEKQPNFVVSFFPYLWLDFCSPFVLLRSFSILLNKRWGFAISATGNILNCSQFYCWKLEFWNCDFCSCSCFVIAVGVFGFIWIYFFPAVHVWECLVECVWFSNISGLCVIWMYSIPFTISSYPDNKKVLRLSFPCFDLLIFKDICSQPLTCHNLLIP